MTKKILIIGLWLAGFCATATAQTQWLDRPLRYASADSVMTWTYGGADFRQLAVTAEPSTRMAVFGVTKEMRNMRDAMAAEWGEMVRRLNVAGGGDDELRAPQGVPAAVSTSMAATLYLMTGDAGYMEHVERALYNATLHALTDSTATIGGDDRRAAAEVLMAAPGLIYATTPERNDLFVNLYTNATAVLHMGGQTFTFDQITDMPDDGQVKFRFTQLRGAMPLRVHLRIPDWAVRRTSARPGTPYIYIGHAPMAPQIYVNGHELDSAKPDSAGYMTIDREWRTGDEIFIAFDLSPQYLRRTDAQGRALRGQLALQCGPLLYAVTTDLDGCYFSANTLPQVRPGESAGGSNALSGYAFRHAGTPQDAEAPRVPYVALPYREVQQGSVWVTEMK